MLERHSELLTVIGDRIRRTRTARGRSMKIAADIRKKYGVKLDPSYLSRIERGKTEIPLRTLLAIADYFEIRPGFLLDYAPSDSPKGTEYVFMDPQLVQYIIRLKDLLGEENAREHLQDLLRDILKLINSLSPNSAVIQAARPGEAPINESTTLTLKTETTDNEQQK